MICAFFFKFPLSAADVWRNIALLRTRTCLISASGFIFHNKIQVNMLRLSVSRLTATWKETCIFFYLKFQEIEAPSFFSDCRHNLYYTFKHALLNVGLNCGCTRVICSSQLWIYRDINWRERRSFAVLKKAVLVKSFVYYYLRLLV